MNLKSLTDSIPIGTLIGLLTLLPLVSGLLIWITRQKAVQIGAVIVTAWVMTGASLLLFLWSAIEQKAIWLSPGNIGSVSANTLITIADIALLVGFCAIGAVRKRPLILVLGLAQLGAMVWFEFFSGKHLAETAPIRIDWLSVIMVLVVSIIGTIIATYALPYMRDHEAMHPVTPSKQPRFFLLILIFLGAMNGLTISDNLFWLMCFWEVTTLCSFLLIGHDNTEEARRNSERALWMNLLGGASLLAGVLLFAFYHNTVSIARILELGATPAGHAIPIMLALACVCLAGFTKAAQMPFQGWLLGAMVAPTPVSALLHSSTMVKAGVYLIIRFAPAFHDTALSEVVALSGAFTFAAGALLAIGQTNGKALLAYSTISNLGLIIACAGLNTPLALTAAVMLLIFHAISKGLLFMAVGVVDQHIHTKDIEQMQGLVSRMPLTTFIMVIGILSMLLPPFGVLIAKLVAIEASITLPPVLFLLVAGSTFTVVFWTKWTGRLLTAAPGTSTGKIEKLHSMYLCPLLLLLTGAVLFSLLVVPVLTELVSPAVQNYYSLISPKQHFSFQVSEALNFPWIIVAAALVMAVCLPMLFMRTKREDIRGAYLCGEQVGDSSSVTFKSVGEANSELAISGYYFDKIVGEKRHLLWMTTVGTLLCLSLFGVASLWK